MSYAEQVATGTTMDERKTRGGGDVALATGEIVDQLDRLGHHLERLVAAIVPVLEPRDPKPEPPVLADMSGSPLGSMLRAYARRIEEAANVVADVAERVAL